MCCHGKLKITGPLEVSVHLASLQALTKVDRELGTCKNLARKPNAKGGVAFAFKKTRGGRKGKENKKSQRGRLGVCCRKLRTFTDFSGAAVKYLSSKGDGTDIRTMRSNAETCVNSRLEGL